MRAAYTLARRGAAAQSGALRGFAAGGLALSRVIFCGVAAVVLAGCAPSLEERLSLVDAPRVLAIAASPPEVAPGEALSLELLFADPESDAPSGGDAAASFDWALCVERKALSEPGSVSPECLAPKGDALLPLGGGEAVSGVVPDDACRLFGPDPPPPVAGQPAGRAADPDASGGYYQPLRVRFTAGGEDAYVVGALRIACGLPGATPDQALEMARRYRRNERPALRSLALVRGGESEVVAPDAAGEEPSVSVAAGETITFRAAWDACPSAPECGDAVCGIDEDAASCAGDCAAPAGCAGAEQYLLFDAEARELRGRREAIQISWYATAGELAYERTGRAAEEAAQSRADNTWTAPGEAGAVTLWAVIRDDRGGAGWQRYRLRVDE